MLRVTLLANEKLTLKLEGKISGPWVQVFEECWTRARVASKSDVVRADLTDVTFVEDAGKDLLARMARAGTEFVATGPLIPVLVKMNNIQVMGPYQNQGPSLGDHHDK
jgi:anti-anti-sigma regulatory factor